MTWKQFRFCLYCALLWPATIIVASRMHLYLGAAVWWFGSKSGAITDSLRQFQNDTALMQCLLFGFFLGCIPVSRLREFAAASLGHWRHLPSANPQAELDPSQPLLWAWVLPSIVFCIRFVILLYEGTGRSVLGHSSVPLIGTFGYFFSNSATFEYSGDAETRLIDHFFVIQPMLFTAMYPVAVWMRYNRPMREPIGQEHAEVLGLKVVPNEQQIPFGNDNKGG